MDSVDPPPQTPADPDQPVTYRSNRLRFFVMVAALGLVVGVRAMRRSS